MSDDLLPDDDLSIPDEELLYIRIFPGADTICLNPATGHYRPTSGAIKDPDGPLSVDLQSRSTPEQTRDRDQSFPFHVAAFTTGTARKHKCRVVRDPIPQTLTCPGNPAHAHVFGNHENNSGALRYKTQCRPIAREAWIILLNDRAS